MRTPKTDPWQHFDDAFKSIDRAFRSIDWKSMDSWQHTQREDHIDPQGRKIHTLTAGTWRSRRRIAGLFLWLAWRIITRGKATIRL